MQSNRVAEIDYLRGIAMVGMILIHTSYYFLSDNVAFFFWNYSQFAVQVFVFCSAFLFFQKTKEVNHISFGYFISYLRKRFLRLLIPYYIFAGFYFLLILIFDKLTPWYILDSIFLTAGIQINWLILLFLQLTVFIPILKFAFHKQKILFFTFFCFSFASAFYLLVVHIPVSDRIVMWLPWLLVVFYTLFFVHYRNKRYFSLATLFVSVVGFILSRIWLVSHGNSLSFYDNKYPPNIYYILYGIFWIEVLYIAAKKGVFNLPIIKKSLHFLSKYSYSLFFIHYLILYISTKLLPIKNFNWSTFYGAILVSSVLLQIVIINVRSHLLSRFSSSEKRLVA